MPIPPFKFNIGPNLEKNCELMLNGNFPTDGGNGPQKPQVKPMFFPKSFLDTKKLLVESLNLDEQAKHNAVQFLTIKSVCRKSSFWPKVG